MTSASTKEWQCSLARAPCAVCLEPLCEPVRWPGDCGHCYCLLCSTRLRIRSDQATCPLCRAPAGRVCREADVQIDKELSSLLRSRGAVKYDSQKALIRKEVRQLWKEQRAKTTTELPLLCVGSWDFPQGARRGLQLLERRELAVADMALAEPSRSFGVVLAARATPGAPGRVAKVVGHTSLPEGGAVVVIEGGESFNLRSSSLRRTTSEPRLRRGGASCSALHGQVRLGDLPPSPPAVVPTPQPSPASRISNSSGETIARQIRGARQERNTISRSLSTGALGGRRFPDHRPEL